MCKLNTSVDTGSKYLECSAEKPEIQIQHGSENKNYRLKGVHNMLLGKWVQTFRKNLPPPYKQSPTDTVSRQLTKQISPKFWGII